MEKSIHNKENRNPIYNKPGETARRTPYKFQNSAEEDSAEKSENHIKYDILDNIMGTIDKLNYLEDEKFLYPSVFERKTNLDNLTILSIKNINPQSSFAIYKKIKESKEDLNAVSLELDKNLQPFLDHFFNERRMTNYDEFPGFAYVMSYCITNKIPIFASDKSQQEYLREIVNLDSKLQETSDTESLSKIFQEWKFSYDILESKRAEKTAYELKELSKKIEGNFVHLASENQARKIEEFI